MDELNIKISTKFMRNALASLITRLLIKKLGYQIDTQIEELSVETTPEGNFRIHANIDAEISKTDFASIIKSIGLK